jgi:hypothetical protein
VTVGGQAAPVADAAGEAEKGFVNGGANLAADPQPPEPVQQRDGLPSDPVVPARAELRPVARRAMPGRWSYALTVRRGSPGPRGSPNSSGPPDSPDSAARWRPT